VFCRPDVTHRMASASAGAIGVYLTARMSDNHLSSLMSSLNGKMVFSPQRAVTMDSAEKKRLKKFGKHLVEQRSRELQDRLHEANPEPVGSDGWVRNYKVSTARERQLRTPSSFLSVPPATIVWGL
jgi:hypothetical protein